MHGYMGAVIRRTEVKKTGLDVQKRCYFSRLLGNGVTVAQQTLTLFV
jgi:hypothetical protein